MCNFNLMKDDSEIVQYNNPNIPFYLKKGKLSIYPNMSALCHWHEDIEYIKILKGHMTYYVNGNKFLIEENDAILVNSKQMHYGYSEDGSDCEFICIVFKATLLCSNPEIQNKYINSIIEDENISASYLSAKNKNEEQIISILDNIVKIFESKQTAYELQIISNLQLFWSMWFNLLQYKLSTYNVQINKNTPILKKMVKFIHTNFDKKITLNEIAASGNICRSKCCKLFNNNFNTSPIEYLNSYRLEVSTNLLRDTTLSIVDVAYACGFNSSSYYSELFMKFKGCTPSYFRKQQHNYL